MTETTGQKPSLADLFRECTQALERSSYTPSPSNPLYYIGPVFTVQLHVPVQTFTLRGPMSHLTHLVNFYQWAVGLVGEAATMQEFAEAVRSVWETASPVPGFSVEGPESLISAVREYLEAKHR